MIKFLTILINNKTDFLKNVVIIIYSSLFLSCGNLNYVVKENEDNYEHVFKRILKDLPVEEQNLVHKSNEGFIKAKLSDFTLFYFVNSNLDSINNHRGNISRTALSKMFFLSNNLNFLYKKEVVKKKEASNYIKTNVILSEKYFSELNNFDCLSNSNFNKKEVNCHSVNQALSLGDLYILNTFFGTFYLTFPSIGNLEFACRKVSIKGTDYCYFISLISRPWFNYGIIHPNENLYFANKMIFLNQGEEIIILGYILKKI